jgi:hypothetical protein
MVSVISSMPAYLNELLQPPISGVQTALELRHRRLGDAADTHAAVEIRIHLRVALAGEMD